VLLPRQPKDKGRSDAVLKFFKWSIENGQDQAKKLDYVPLPADLVKQIEDYIGANIK
jgi:phosphate transport system substrate-binding protein